MKRVVILLVLLLGGCRHSVYQLEIEPQGDQFQRRFSGWSTDSDSKKSPLSAEEVELLKSAYGEGAVRRDKDRHVCEGRFSTMPKNGIGGAARYVHWQTSLGTASAYVERLRGSDDYQLHLQRRAQAVDDLVDTIQGWLAQELAAHPGRKHLDETLGVVLRRELHNLALHCWKHDRRNSPEELVMRLAMMLGERGLFQFADLPTLARALQDPSPAGEQVRLKLARKSVSVALKSPGAGDPLGFLASTEALQQSFQRYAAQSQQFAALYRRLEVQQQQDDPESDDASGQVLGLLLLQAFLPEIVPLVPDDELQARLATDAAPFWTNGAAASDGTSIEWDDRISNRKGAENATPHILFAAWSTPDAARQTRALGRVALKEQRLAQYCLWHAGLGNNEARQWDQMIDQLQPARAAETIGQFRFAGENQETESAAAPAQELLLESLAAENTDR